MFQKLIFKPRGKSNKSCIKDTAKNKRKKKTKIEKDTEDPKILDEREKVEKEEDKSRDERVNTSEVEAARESETSKEREASCEEDRKIDDGIEISIETVEKKDVEAETKDKGAVNDTKEEGEEEKIALDQEGSKENGEPLENGAVQEVTETVVIVETESETKDKEDGGVAEAEAVVENGVETDEEKEEGEKNEIKCQTEEPAGVEIIAKDIVTDSQATPTNQSPEE